MQTRDGATSRSAPCLPREPTRRCSRSAPPSRRMTHLARSIAPATAFARALLRDERGAATAESGVLVAIMVAVTMAALVALKGSVTSVFDRVGESMHVTVDSVSR